MVHTVFDDAINLARWENGYLMQKPMAPGLTKPFYILKDVIPLTTALTLVRRISAFGCMEFFSNREAQIDDHAPLYLAQQ